MNILYLFIYEILFINLSNLMAAVTAQSVKRLAMAGRPVDRIPVEARYSAPVQTGPVAHPAYCTMGTGSLPGVKRPGSGADPPPHLQCQVLKRVELYLYIP